MDRRASLLGALTLMWVVVACGDSNGEPTGPDPPTDSTEVSSCVGCHTDYDLLRTIHTPDSVIPSGGCSGPPPYVQPYDRVYLEPRGFAAFEASSHGDLACTACHGGVEGTDDKATAHSANFVRFPSFQALETCEDCHNTVVSNFQSSLHYNGWGQKNAQITRAGVNSFQELHPGIQEGYDANCATCHASCGSCHVNRPPAGGGGLMDGHAFAAPDMRNNCTACHASRGGHAYYGEGTGTQPDVHLTKAGYTCMDCHTTGELHGGDGTVYAHRYQVKELPKCADCHTDIGASNMYHMTHIDDLSCHTCHSQDYNTCGNCHVAGEGARIQHHLDFKIGRNPLAEKPFKFSILRRTPAAPDTWDVFGVDPFSTETFDDKPLYNYTTPHNILRWTRRTQVESGQTCSTNCHVRVDAGTGSYVNRGLYLFSDDFLTEWERQAAAAVVVDGHLPAAWTAAPQQGSQTTENEER